MFKNQVKGKTNFTISHATKAQRDSRDVSILSLTSVIEFGGLSTSRPRRFIPDN